MNRAIFPASKMAFGDDNCTNMSRNPGLPLYPFAGRSKTSVVVETVVACLLIVVGLVGNCLVCFVIHRSRRTKSSMYYFMASLAFADLLVCCVSVPLTIISTQPEPLFPTMSSWLCKAIRFIQFALPPASVAILTATALDRYFHICHPLKVVITTNTTKWLAMCCWLFAAFITIPVPLLLSSRPTQCHKEIICNFCSMKASVDEIPGSVYLVGRVFLSFIIPEVIIIVLYYKVAKAVWDRGTSSSSRDKINIIKSLTMVVVAFSLSWAPFSLVTKYHTFKNPSVHTISTAELITYWLGLFASVYNPFIYTFYNRNFREAFREVCLGKRPLPPGCSEAPPCIPFRPRYLSMPDIRAVARKEVAELPTPRSRALSFSVASSSQSDLQAQVTRISELHALFELKSPAKQAVMSQPARSGEKNSRRNSDPNRGLNPEQNSKFDAMMKCQAPRASRYEVSDTELPLVKGKDSQQNSGSKSKQSLNGKKKVKNGMHRIKRPPRPRLRIQLASLKLTQEPEPNVSDGKPTMELLEVPGRSEFVPKGRRATKTRSTTTRHGDRPQNKRNPKETELTLNNNSDVMTSSTA